MLKRFFAYYKPYKRLFIVDFTSAVIVAILELAFPVAVQWFIDELLPGDDWGIIVTAAVLLLFVYLLSTFLQYVVTYYGHKLGVNIETDMRKDLFFMCKNSLIAFLIIRKPVTLLAELRTTYSILASLPITGRKIFSSL